MMRAVNRPLALAAIASALALVPHAASASGEAPHIERETWSFGGLRGQYDQAQLQRGFQIYKDVCANCHGLRRVYFRNLVQPGGPQFPEDAVKALAASWPNKITDGPDDKGKMFERPAKLFDPILGPYKNDNEARANQNGALPPDLSLIAKARNVGYSGPFWAHPFSMLRDVATSYQEGGADYLHALLTGYEDQPPAFKRDAEGRLHPVGADETFDEKAVERCASVTLGEDGKPDVCNKLQDGMMYNKAFPGHQIAMPQPLSKDGFVKYQDGTGSLEENSRDIAAFLSWAADPHLNDRKHTGWLVLIYLLVTTVLLYLGKKRIWSKIPH
jgi:ubiquinol-cytochrome c reductase cytochrome c1 subunit